jgi:hypothetical protein
VAKLVSLLRKRGVIMLAVSVVSALLSAKGVIHPDGYWDGPI